MTSGSFPAAVDAKFLCGMIAPDELFSSLQSTPEVLHQRELCQASFYAAIAPSAETSADRRRAHLQKAAACDRALLEAELYLARAELHAA